jgi:hypothetical protein
MKLGLGVAVVAAGAVAVLAAPAPATAAPRSVISFTAAVAGQDVTPRATVRPPARMRCVTHVSPTRHSASATCVDVRARTRITLFVSCRRLPGGVHVYSSTRYVRVATRAVTLVTPCRVGLVIRAWVR